LGQPLAQLKRHAAAADAFREGLVVVATTFIARYAQNFGDVAGALTRGYVTACENAGIIPDTGLLERVALRLKEA
jgi:hypothetical protein